ncbi:hypothetical protein [Cognatilysobacter segetis]|uniref:hypothetical protein n=1 Tax=Cognatilysobacter segetis TaxID=2492394 RepID=UPI00105F585B|nr:hypothetical protein [Lysobacter segetis]
MTASTTPHAHRHLRDAVAALCREGPLAERLDAAHRQLAAIDPVRDLPAALQFRFEELVADITYGADTVADALARMSAPDREHLALRVVSLFDDALRLLAADA